MSALAVLLPELVLSVGTIVAIAVDVLVRDKRTVAWTCALFALLACGLAAGQWLNGAIGSAGPLFAVDAVAAAARVGVLAATTLLLIAMPSSRELRGHGAGEYAVLLLGLGLGGCVFAGATNLLSLYLGLEFLSLTGYCLAGLKARDRHAAEAGMKYVMFGALASALTLFGMSYLYGLAGSLDLVAIGTALARPEAPAIAIAPVLLLACGLAYKLALVPFHLYSPDVYEGAPTLSAAALSVIPKIAGAAAAVHVLATLIPAGSGLFAADRVTPVIAGLALLTMTVGNLTALAQRNAKRILAFSGAIGAVGFYLLAYLFMNLGAFLALMLIENRTGSSDLGALAGSWKAEPLAVIGLAVCVFALAGIPPLAGFTAKWTVLRAVADAGFADGGRPWLIAAAVVLLVNSVLSVVPYLRVVRAVAVEGGEIKPAAEPPHAALAVVAMCVGACLILGLLWPVVAALRDALG
jgi:NADH-quinone oxidoreductase subunit N